MILLALPFIAVASGILGFAAATHPRVVRHEQTMWGIFVGCCVISTAFVVASIMES